MLYHGDNADSGLRLVIDALDRYLEFRHHLQPLQGGGVGDLAVFCHRFPRVRLPASVLATIGLPEKRIILVEEPSLVTASNNRSGSDLSMRQVFVLRARSGTLAELDQFLQRQPGIVESGRVTLRSAQFEGLLRRFLGGNLNIKSSALWSSCGRADGLSEAEADIFGGFIAELLISDHSGAVPYALHLINDRYVAKYHGLQSTADLAFDDHAPEARRLQRLREACQDLYESLKQGLDRSDSSADTILVIDDRADEEAFTSELKAIRKALLPRWQLKPCNPMKRLPGSRWSLHDLLAEYQTIAFANTHDFLKKWAGDELTGVRFILVDQFLPRNGSDEFTGPRVIRGLSRLLRDLDSPPLPLPELVALSRDGDSRRVLEALRAGARDYVVKSRILALPAVLARVARGTADPIGAVHRNFRALYNLPNETIGLLRAATIPEVRWDDRDPRPGGVASDEISARVARLLSAFPKTDLHVHAGSCMSPEFLVVASLIGLARRETPDGIHDLVESARIFHRALRGEWEPSLTSIGETVSGRKWNKIRRAVQGNQASWIDEYGAVLKNEVKEWLRRLTGSVTTRNGRDIKASAHAYLHMALGLPSYLPVDELSARVNGTSHLQLVLAAVMKDLGKLRKDPSDGERYDTSDLLRIYVLVLATRYPDTYLAWDNVDLLDLFRVQAEKGSGLEARGGAGGARGAWQALRGTFYGGHPRDTRRPCWSIEGFRARGGRLPRGDSKSTLPLELRLKRRPSKDDRPQKITFALAPLEYTLASGLRSRNRNLGEYLEGCEFSGAEHLRHPFLIHLYAQQVLAQFIEKGVVYAELRGSPDGYVDTDLGFELPEVIRCLVAAFGDAQTAILHTARGEFEHASGWMAQVLGDRRYNLDEVGRRLRSEGQVLDRRLPCKVSLIFAGKRHKPSREMILEAAAAAVMRPGAQRRTERASSAEGFATREMGRCRVVGFDLAGPELGGAPSLFIDEFSRLSAAHPLDRSCRGERVRRLCRRRDS